MSDPIKVLVIEDDVHTQNIVQKVLTQDISLRFLHLKVTMAADGEEGLQKYNEIHPQLVITDLLMPKVDGFQVVESIRKQPEGKEIPVLVTSAVYRDKKTHSTLTKEFKVHFLPKPFSPKTLAIKVLSILRPGKTSASPVRHEIASPSRNVPLASPLTKAASAPLAPPDFSPVHLNPPDFPAAPMNPEAVEASLQGDLMDRPLPQLLLEFYENQLFGTLEITQGKVRKLIYLMSGHPIFVQSNLRGETLGQMLIRRGVLTHQQHEQTLTHSKEAGKKYGEALVGMGFLSEGEVMQELVTQTYTKIEACLRWKQGIYIFRADRDVGAKVPRCTIDPVQLVFAGLKNYPDVEEAYTLIADCGNHAVRLAERFTPYREAFTKIFGNEILNEIAYHPSVSHLVQVTQAAPDAILQLHALLFTGLAELTLMPNMLEGPLVPPPAAAIPLEHLAQSDPLDFEPLAALAPEPGVDNLSSAVVWLEEPDAGPPPSNIDPQKIQTALQLIHSVYLGLHDATHYEVLGVMPQSILSNIEVAYQIKRRQFELDNFRDMDLGEHYGHLEEICGALDEAFYVLSDPVNRSSYDQKLRPTNAPTPQDTAYHVDALCRHAEAAYHEGDYLGAAQNFQRAVQLDDQSEFRAMIAFCLFMAADDKPLASENSLKEIMALLSSNPGEVTLYLVAARIFREIKKYDEAIDHLQALIKIDPTLQEGFDELENLLLELGQLDQLELEYRRIIHLLGVRDPEWSTILWLRLTLLYRDRLHDPHKTRIACTSALRLAPNNRDLRTILVELNKNDPDHWPEAILGYRALFHHDPQQEGPVHELFQLHRAAARTDAAYIAASVAHSRGFATEEEVQWLEANQPTILQLAHSPLEPSLLESLRHSDDDPHMATLFRILAPTIQTLHPLRMEDLDLRPEEILPASELPEPFAQVLQYIADTLKLEPPGVVLKQDLDLEIQGVGTNPPLLMVGRQALQQTNSFELAFRLGRALSLLTPERMIVSWRPRRLLRSYIMACLATAYTDQQTSPADEALLRIKHELEQSADLLVAVKGTIINLSKKFNQLNLSDWQRGLQRSADRVGLLLCTDVVVAARILARQDSTAELELLEFALGETYGELRASLGLALD